MYAYKFRGNKGKFIIFWKMGELQYASLAYKGWTTLVGTGSTSPSQNPAPFNCPNIGLHVRVAQVKTIWQAKDQMTQSRDSEEHEADDVGGHGFVSADFFQFQSVGFSLAQSGVH